MFGINENDPREYLFVTGLRTSLKTRLKKTLKKKKYL